MKKSFTEILDKKLLNTKSVKKTVKPAAKKPAKKAIKEAYMAPIRGTYRGEDEPKRDYDEIFLTAQDLGLFEDEEDKFGAAEEPADSFGADGAEDASDMDAAPAEDMGNDPSSEGEDIGISPDALAKVLYAVMQQQPSEATIDAMMDAMVQQSRSETIQVTDLSAVLDAMKQSAGGDEGGMDGDMDGNMGGDEEGTFEPSDGDGEDHKSGKTKLMGSEEDDTDPSMAVESADEDDDKEEDEVDECDAEVKEGEYARSWKRYSGSDADIDAIYENSTKGTLAKTLRLAGLTETKPARK